MFVYQPRNSPDLYVFDTFNKAITKLLSDEGFFTFLEYLESLEDNLVYVNFEKDSHFIVDDGPKIIKAIMEKQ